MAGDGVGVGNSGFCGTQSGQRWIFELTRKNDIRGAGGAGALQASPPVRGQQSVDTNPHAALRALLVGLRSTPFDCVAIAPCCFAECKAVLSHALAALTALVPARKPRFCGNFPRGALRSDLRTKNLKFLQKKSGPFPVEEAGIFVPDKPYLASATATATATEAPTIGLLPIPIRPIISTCAGTLDEPANCASPCIRPIVSVMP